jgi:RNA-directed DNA polymerase
MKRLEGKRSRPWLKLNWGRIQETVSKQQYEIGVACREGDFVTVKDLQKKLTLSFEARALAVRRVTTSSVNQTPGVDGVVLSSTSSKYKMIATLGKVAQTLDKYEARPVKRVWIPKPGKVEEKPLGIPTIRDRCVQALVLLGLDPVVEETSDEQSYGFRRFRSAGDAITRIMHIFMPRTYRGTLRPAWSCKLWDADIERCFDRISHEFLLRKLKHMYYEIGPIRSWLEAPIIDKGVSTGKNTRGTPQGGIISPVLANVALNGLQQCVSKSVGSATRVHIVRYADDFIVTYQKDSQRMQFEPAIRKFLSERGLNISERKSHFMTIEEGFDFLGWNIRLRPWKYYHNKPRKRGEAWPTHVVICVPMKSKVTSVKKQIKDAFDSTNNVQAVIRLVNPIIRGWCNYYSTSYHSQRVFKQLGNYVYNTTMRWLRRKHPTRGGKWLVKKYNFPVKGNSWRFGISKDMVIANPLDTLNHNLRLLKKGQNPYVESDYWESKELLRGYQGFRKTILGIWKEKCALCKKSLWSEEGGETHEFHHIIAQKDGGGHTLKNVVPLHKTCHQVVTELNLKQKAPWVPTNTPTRYKKIVNLAKK